jgi:hypothetical protein
LFGEWKLRTLEGRAERRGEQWWCKMGSEVVYRRSTRLLLIGEDWGDTSNVRLENIHLIYQPKP